MLIIFLNQQQLMLRRSFRVTLAKLKKTRKGVPELRGPASVCLSAIDKKSVYWSLSWARILYVQDIIN